MGMVDTLAGAATFIAVLAGLLSRKYRGAAALAVAAFAVMFAYAAAIGFAFPMGLAHLGGAAVLGSVGNALRLALHSSKLGRPLLIAMAACVTASVAIGALVAAASGDRRTYRGIFSAVADYQDERLAHAKAMVRGQAKLPIYEEWRSLTEAASSALLQTLVAQPIQYAGTIYGFAIGYIQNRRLVFLDNGLYRSGKAAKDAIDSAFPSDPARKYEFTHMIVQGFSNSDPERPPPWRSR